ncbi:type III polyketide synthase [Herbiconiux sp. SYSU D00978]|uniref:type III polyketide synthase n=1 Tax=Herbiconiux sp. SYSU D00978 TaxID=2812562 RepID=UPI001A977AC9|nr:3-oxoacyl-[acyl-carrier-protein] synthase III C-terminal domain-containing protein [Herbiconiux sp. SYSU D00978]
MSRIAAVSAVLPRFSYAQDEITAEIGPLLSGDASKLAVLQRMHRGAGVERRHLALPLGEYRELRDFHRANDTFIRVGLELLEEATADALDKAGLAATDVDHIFFTSVTGISAPSLDALLVPRVGFRPDVKRVPSFGLGCVAGASGLRSVHDYLEGHPGEVALLLSVELCSLTIQRQDDSVANLVASGLFGDGASAVVVTGDQHPAARGPRIVDTRSSLYPDTMDVIGWDVGGSGFSIVLGAGVPAVVDAHFETDVSGLLAANGIDRDEVTAYVAHPGGPRVLEAFARSLAIPDSALQPSWDLLARAGNLSSSAVLHVLADMLEQPLGTRGLLFALGPGVTAELVLLEWDAAAALPAAPVLEGAA